MKISEKMIEQIKSFEGCSNKAYLDSAGIPTIGIGHTGNDVTMGDIISSEEVIRLFRKDIARFENSVNRLNEHIITKSKGVMHLSQCQFDALVSLIYNAGEGAIKNGTTLGNLLYSCNHNKSESISKGFMLWVKATINGKKVVLGGADGKHGLVLRRAIEAAWYTFGENWENELRQRRITDVVEWARS